MVDESGTQFAPHPNPLPKGARGPDERPTPKRLPLFLPHPLKCRAARYFNEVLSKYPTSLRVSKAFESVFVDSLVILCAAQ